MMPMKLMKVIKSYSISFSKYFLILLQMISPHNFRIEMLLKTPEYVENNDAQIVADENTIGRGIYLNSVGEIGSIIHKLNNNKRNHSLIQLLILFLGIFRLSLFIFIICLSMFRFASK